MRALSWIVFLVVLAGGGYYLYEKYVDVVVPPQILYAAVGQGDVTMTVKATGTLQATRTVNVGTQVTGVVKRMFVDFNSIVKKDQLIATIDPQLSEAALNSAVAAYDKAKISLEEDEATLAVDQRNQVREDQLYDHQLAMVTDKETADLTVKEDQATVDQDKAAIVIANAGVEQAKTTLAFCKITSPINGVVVQRNADEGQTVTSSLAVPSLYVIAQDIETLELSGAVDESDIGNLHPGQDVAFTVEAYGTRQFHGTMTHVRLYATTVNNVVTYQAIVAVPNQDLRLLPSMTAQMTVDVGRATNVLRVPNSALRFRPTRDTYLAINQQPPDSSTIVASAPSSNTWSP